MPHSHQAQNDNTNSFGNLLRRMFFNPSALNKQYKLTGIYTSNSNGNNYTCILNKNVYNADTNLEINNYYDISSLNIKAKSFELTPDSKTNYSN